VLKENRRKLLKIVRVSAVKVDLNSAPDCDRVELAYHVRCRKEQRQREDTQDQQGRGEALHTTEAELADLRDTAQ
jgi:hypothetical protein